MKKLIMLCSLFLFGYKKILCQVYYLNSINILNETKNNSKDKKALEKKTNIFIKLKKNRLELHYGCQEISAKFSLLSDTSIKLGVASEIGFCHIWDNGFFAEYMRKILLQRKEIFQIKIMSNRIIIQTSAYNFIFVKK